MSQSTVMQPVTPWYREPWPWILMTGPAIVVIAGFFTLYLAVSRPDPVVVDNYYKEGLAINRVLERDAAAAKAGYRAQAMMSTDHSRVRMQLIGQGDLPQKLKMKFVHPTKAGMDQEVLLQQTQPGWYEGKVSLAAAQRWDVDLDDLAQKWHLDGQWYSSEPTFKLEPRVAAR